MRVELTGVHVPSDTNTTCVKSQALDFVAWLVWLEKLTTPSMGELSVFEIDSSAADNSGISLEVCIGGTRLDTCALVARCQHKEVCCI